MRTWAYLCALGLFSSAVYAGQSTLLPAPTDIVTPLVPYEIWEPLIVENGVLWVGQIKKDDQDSFKLEAYDQDGTRRLDVAVINHSAVRLIRLPNKRIAVLGRTSYPHKFEMTVAWIENERIRTAPVNVPGDFTYNAMFHNGVWYGVDPGDGIFFRFGRNEYDQYPAEYSMPDKLLGIGNEAWIVERRTPASGDEVLSVTNLSTRVRKSVFETTRDGLYNLTKSKDDKYVIATAAFEQNVFLIDVSSKKVRSTLHLDYTPFGVVAIGNGCFATVNGETQTISILKQEGENLSLIEGWDISSAGDRLKFPTQLDFDPVYQSVFVKSSYTCPSCQVSQASVFRVKFPEGSAAKGICL